MADTAKDTFLSRNEKQFLTTEFGVKETLVSVKNNITYILQDLVLQPPHIELILPRVSRDILRTPQFTV